MNHLTDSVLQRYLEEDASLNRADIETHLKTCVRCREELVMHRILATALDRVPESDLPIHFADRVVGCIESLQEARERRQEWLWMILIGLAGVGITLYYSSMPMTINSGDLASQLKSVQNVLPFAQRFGGWLGDHASLLIFGVFLLLLFDQLDRRLLRFRAQH